MPSPNPILGVHAAVGSTAWASVRREQDGSFLVVASGIEASPADPAEAVAHAGAIAARRPFRGRGAFIALPDSSGCLVTALLAADELDLTGRELVRELHEYTPFEPDVATLRFRLLRVDGRRREMLVAALPAAQERRLRDAASPRGDASIAFGFGSAAIVRGARALGLCDTSCYLVEMHAQVTHVFALDGERARRYLLPAGADDLVASAAAALARPVAAVRDAVAAGAVDAATQTALDAAASDLAADIREITRYHVVQQYVPKDPPEDLPPPRFRGVGPILGRAPIRRALAAHLGGEFALGGPVAASPGESRPVIAWNDAPGDRMAALAGAVGAALEAFEPSDAQLALESLPADLPAVSDRSAWPRAAAAVVVAAAVGGWFWMNRPDTFTPTAAPGNHAAPHAPAAVGEAARAVALIDVTDAVAELIGDGFAPTRVELTWTGAGYDVACDAVGAALRTPRVARLAPRVRDESWSQGDGKADVISYSGRWFAPAPGQPEELDAEAAEHLDTALGAWRAARSDAAQPAGDAVSPPGLVALLARSDAGTRIVAQCAPDGTQASVVSSEPADTGRRATGPAARDGAEFVSDVAPRLRAELVASPIVSPGLALGTAPSDAGGVVLTWTDAAARRLQTRTPGEPWSDVSDVSADAGTWVAGAEQLAPSRRWRLVSADGRTRYAGTPIVARPLALAEIVSIAPGDGQSVRLVLRGVGAAAARTASGEVALGAEAALTAATAEPGAGETLDAGVRVRAVRIVQSLEATTVRLPAFRPDGRVVRGADGAPVWTERRETRPVRIAEADLVHPSGRVETVSRKMTDG